MKNVNPVSGTGIRTHDLIVGNFNKSKKIESVQAGIQLYSDNVYSFFKNGPTSASFSFIFCFLQTNITNFYNKYM